MIFYAQIFTKVIIPDPPPLKKKYICILNLMVLELKFIIKIIKFVKIMCRLITCTLEINRVNYCNHSIIFVGVKIIMSYPKLYDSCLWTRYMCVNKTFNKLLYLVSNVGMSKLKKGTFIFIQREGENTIYIYLDYSVPLSIHLYTYTWIVRRFSWKFLHSDMNCPDND